MLLLLFLHWVRKYMVLTLMLGYKRTKLAPVMSLRHWLIILPQPRYQELCIWVMYFSISLFLLPFFFSFLQALQKKKQASRDQEFNGYIFHWLFYQQHMKNPKGQKQLANQWGIIADFRFHAGEKDTEAPAAQGERDLHLGLVLRNVPLLCLETSL